MGTAGPYRELLGSYETGKSRVVLLVRYVYERLFIFTNVFLITMQERLYQNSDRCRYRSENKPLECPADQESRTHTHKV